MTAQRAPRFHRENLNLVQYLEPRARKASAPTDFDIDEWELHTHPDLTERLGQVAELAGAPLRLVPLFGVPVLVDQEGVVSAFAEGMNALVFRVGETQIASKPHSIPGWREFDAFDPEVPTDEQLSRLTEICRAAAQR